MRTIRSFYNGVTRRVEAELLEIDERGTPNDDGRKCDEHYYVVIATDADGYWQAGERYIVRRDAEGAYLRIVDSRAGIA